MPESRFVRAALAVAAVEFAALGAVAEPVLVPIPWASVRIGRDKCGAPVETVTVTLGCGIMSFQGGCLSDGKRDRTIEVAPLLGVVDVSDGPVRLLAVLKHELEANRWSTGFSYLRIDGPELPAVGSVVDSSTVSWWSASVVAHFRGEATLPTYDGVGTSDLLMRGAPNASPDVWAQSTDRCGDLPPGVSTFLGGDAVVVERSSNASNGESIEISQDSSTPYTTRISSIRSNSYTACGSFSPGVATACVDTLELFSVPPPNALSANLACRSDLNADGTVNFGDLARLKSVFFQRCIP